MNLEYNLIFLSEAELELKWIIIRYNVHTVLVYAFLHQKEDSTKILNRII